MLRKETEVLADMLDKARQLSLFFISNLKTVDPSKRIVCGDMEFNSIYWLTAHLIWAEHMLVISATGGKIEVPEWLSHYELGSGGLAHEQPIPYKELLQLMKDLHIKVLEYIRNFPEEQLDADNPSGMQFGPDRSNRMMIMHAIRHEGTHGGHLSWIAKMNGIKLL
ncbi:MAG: DinB family protein [Chitinophagales bacterium]